MSEPLKLMCVLAHPDDESLGVGGTLAKYAAEGLETHLVTATRGEKGWKGKAEDYPGPEALGRLREGELQAAAKVLGIRQVCLLGYMDGELDEAEPQDAIIKIARHLREVRPQVVVTFGPDGAYGHPDHIAVSQLTTAATLKAAGNHEELSDLPPHQVGKLYYMAEPRTTMKAYQAAFGDLKKVVDGVERRFEGWDDWAVTTRLDTSDYAETVWEAVSCHRSQLRDYEKLKELPKERWRHIFGEGTYYRTFSLVGGGREIEADLFAGLR